jgi:hypothetical protein
MNNVLLKAKSIVQSLGLEQEQLFHLSVIPTETPNAPVPTFMLEPNATPISKNDLPSHLTDETLVEVDHPSLIMVRDQYIQTKRQLIDTFLAYWNECRTESVEQDPNMDLKPMDEALLKQLETQVQLLQLQCLHIVQDVLAKKTYDMMLTKNVRTTNVRERLLEQAYDKYPTYLPMNEIKRLCFLLGMTEQEVAEW